MASSRWKRFAFFERHSLNLPHEVLQDIIPVDKGSGGVADAAVADDSRRSSASSNRASIRTLNARAQQETDEAVKLVVTTAGLPLTSRIPSSSMSNHHRDVVSDSTTTRSTDANDNDADVVNAMWTSLTACSSPGMAEKSTAAAAGTGAGDSESLLAESSSTTADNAVRLMKGQDTTNSDTTTTPSTSASATSMEGLVLAFLSSRETELVHCVDVTIRCNPPVMTAKKTNDESSSTSTSTHTLSRSVFEDMDGWRGYFCPFVVAGVGPPSSSSSDAAAGGGTMPDTITDIAACRVMVRTQDGEQHCALHLACLSRHQVVVWEDPHLYLSCRRPLTVVQKAGVPKEQQAPPVVYTLPRSSLWSTQTDGKPRVVSIAPGMVAVGTDTAAVLVYVYNYKGGGKNQRTLRRYLRIPPPPSEEGLEVVSVKLCLGAEKASVFVAYHRHSAVDTTQTTQQQSSSSAAGLCCYDMPLPNSSTLSTGSGSNTTLSAPLARHDLDGRYTGSDSLVDSYVLGGGSNSSSNGGGVLQVTVARPDGLYTYSQTEKIGVAPIDGSKLAIALIPPPTPAEKKRAAVEGDDDIVMDPDDGGSNTLTSHNNNTTVGSGYALVASTDEKSGRDAVDIYDVTNKLVAFHLLLSPGHRAVRAAGVTTFPSICSDGSIKGGRSSALVLTSGGTLTSLTEKLTQEKVTLLVQKNLYSAAVRVAYADPSFAPAAITTLYRRYAEHLYRKGDFGSAMDQYIHTIGSLETSHVIFRYLDAPKIPLLVKYLERLRARNLATSVHNELLRTCYLKLNDTEAAEAIASQSTINKASLTSILSNLSNNPKEALSTICALEAEQAAEILVIHGAALARVLPKETAGVVISLCVGTYSPQALAGVNSADVNKMVEYATDDRPKACDPYNVELFASAFIEQPKNLRLILAHCNRNKCPLSPSLRRTLLELTLQEWNQAKRTGDTELQKLRHKEAIACLTDSHCSEIGDYDALVIVQLAGFEEGELLLYERLQMTPVLLERYAKDGSEKSRRQMLAMCHQDPEILADVLGHFVAIASEKLKDKHHQHHGEDGGGGGGGGGPDEKTTDDGSWDDDDSDDDEAEAILEDIQEALALARRHGVLPPVRIARILAGEGTGQFSDDIPASTSANENGQVQHRKTVPLAVALDYVGTILEDSRKEIDRLRGEVEEYNQLCNSMESEIDSLLRTSSATPSTAPSSDSADWMATRRMNIDELYARIRSEDGGGDATKDISSMADPPREAFWRDMNQSEDSFDTIARFFAKGVIR